MKSSFCLILLIAAAIAVPFQPADEYMVQATMTLPYSHLSQPVILWRSATQHKARVDYWGGMNTYIFYPQLGYQLAIVPEIYEKVCFNGTAPEGPSTNDEESLLSMFPDFTGFTLQTGEYDIDGKKCSRWEYINHVFNTTHNYTMYFDMKTNFPVKYHMMGYNNLQGSHYDEYVVEYRSYKEYRIPSSVFEPPSGMDCGYYPGPGNGRPIQNKDKIQMNPSLTFKRIFPHNNNKYQNKFHEYLRKYNKVYNPMEKNERYLNFVNNMKYIEKKNSENHSYKLEMNSFGDLSKEEMMMRFGKLRNDGKKSNGAKKLYKNHNPIKADSLDWRKKGAVTPVKDQAFCGSCWTYGTVGTIEGSLFLKSGHLYNLSTQNILDCAWNYGNNGCEGGEDFRAYQWIIDNGGLESEDTYGPYIGQDGYCHFDKSLSKVSLNAYVNISNYDEVSLMNALIERGPISVSVNVIQSFSFYSSGVLDDIECTGGMDELNHSVLLVGYGSENNKDYWLIKNSWSTHWGDDGYIKVIRKVSNDCGITAMPTFVELN